MIDLSKVGAAAILAMAMMATPASANEKKGAEAAQPVRTAAVASSTMDMPQRSKEAAEPAQRQSGDSNGWGMLAAGLSIGLLIIARRRRG